MKKIISFFAGLKHSIVSWAYRHPIAIGATTGIIVAGALIASHYLLSDRSYEMGHENGIVEGRCEMTCAYLGLGYQMYTENPSVCWCTNRYGQYRPVPYLKKK